MLYGVYVQHAGTKKVSPAAWELVNFYTSQEEVDSVVTELKRRGFKVRVTKHASDRH